MFIIIFVNDSNQQKKSIKYKKKNIWLLILSVNWSFGNSFSHTVWSPGQFANTLYSYFVAQWLLSLKTQYIYFVITSHDQLFFRDSVLTFKCQNDLAPQYVTSKFTKRLKYTCSYNLYAELFADSTIQNGYWPAHIFLQRGQHME